jgi:hypothetical protein
MRHMILYLLLGLLLVGSSACADTAEGTPTPAESAAAVAATTPAATSTVAAAAPEATATATDVPATPTTAPTATALPPTPTPAPTNTPTPTPTPQPTATPVPPTPTPTPVPEPRSYSGTGADVISIEKPGDADDAVLVYVRGNAAGRYFGVTSHAADGSQNDLLVNTTDPYEGVVLMDIRAGQVSTRLQVTAEGEWYIELRPLVMARRVDVPGTIEGSGDDVFIVVGDPDTAHISGNQADRYFGVIAYSNRSHLLVNTTDPYDGRVIVPGDVVLVEVSAEGPWTITFE